MADAASAFFSAFVQQLGREGLRAPQIRRWLWRPFEPAAEAMFGEQRQQTLTHLQAPLPMIEQALAAADGPPVDRDFYRAQKVALILVPGFTHETLRNYSWHEQIQRRDSPHSIVMLHPAPYGQATVEQHHASGGALAMAYLHYPRSNGPSQHIVPALARMLRESASVQAWIDEGRQLFFVGYSYGAALTLELLAALNSGREHAGPVLAASAGMLSLCGDLGGSYLADDALRRDAQFVSIPKLRDYCQRHRWAAKLAGLGTEQLMEDILPGVAALGHEVRQAELQRVLPDLPARLHYFSVAAMQQLQDYRRHWWQLNLDDWAMYRQALVTDPITAYNDGQVALVDNLIPATPQIPPQRNQFLGAVRSHHWGVSYRSFNFGRNRFPRAAFNRALMQVISAQLRAGSSTIGSRRHGSNRHE